MNIVGNIILKYNDEITLANKNSLQDMFVELKYADDQIKNDPYYVLYNMKIEMAQEESKKSKTKSSNQNFNEQQCVQGACLVDDQQYIEDDQKQKQTEIVSSSERKETKDSIEIKETKDIIQTNDEIDTDSPIVTKYTTETKYTIKKLEPVVEEKEQKEQKQQFNVDRFTDENGNYDTERAKQELLQLLDQLENNLKQETERRQNYEISQNDLLSQFEYSVEKENRVYEQYLQEQIDSQTILEMQIDELYTEQQQCQANTQGLSVAIESVKELRNQIMKNPDIFFNDEEDDDNNQNKKINNSSNNQDQKFDEKQNNEQKINEAKQVNTKENEQKIEEKPYNTQADKIKQESDQIIKDNNSVLNSQDQDNEQIQEQKISAKADKSQDISVEIVEDQEISVEIEKQREISAIVENNQEISAEVGKNQEISVEVENQDQISGKVEEKNEVSIEVENQNQEISVEIDQDQEISKVKEKQDENQQNNNIIQDPILVKLGQAVELPISSYNEIILEMNWQKYEGLSVHNLDASAYLYNKHQEIVKEYVWFQNQKSSDFSTYYINQEDQDKYKEQMKISLNKVSVDVDSIYIAIISIGVNTNFEGISQINFEIYDKEINTVKRTINLKEIANANKSTSFIGLEFKRRNSDRNLWMVRPRGFWTAYEGKIRNPDQVSAVIQQLEIDTFELDQYVINQEKNIYQK